LKGYTCFVGGEKLFPGIPGNSWKFPEIPGNFPPWVLECGVFIGENE
jgi:hypothetical protein